MKKTVICNMIIPMEESKAIEHQLLLAIPGILEAFGLVISINVFPHIPSFNDGKYDQHDEIEISIEFPREPVDPKEYIDVGIIIGQCFMRESMTLDKVTSDYYEQGTQSVEIDEFTKELLDFSKKDLGTGEQITLMYIDDHTVIGDQENYNAMMHLLKEKQAKT
jgi:hypothetical protein